MERMTSSGGSISGWNTVQPVMLLVVKARSAMTGLFRSHEARTYGGWRRSPRHPKDDVPDLGRWIMLGRDRPESELST
jgi:hypothetical protein